MIFPTRIAKATERERVSTLLDLVSGSIRRAFRAFLKDATSEPSMAQVRQALERGDLYKALDVVDRHVVSLGNVLPRAFAAAGETEARNLERKFRNTGAQVALHFDPTNERAADIVRSSRMRFVTEFTREQRATTQLALSRALRTGASFQDAARDFVGSIGLTRTQYASVENYRSLLERQSRAALDRALRDPRFDATVENSIETGVPLSPSQVNRMVDRYHDRMLAMRSEAIARTEGLAAVSEARDEAMAQLVDAAGFEPDQVRRVWVATDDARTRDHHAEMDGQSVGMDEPFISGLGNKLMFPGDPSAPAEERIHCRCSVVYEFGAVEEAEAA